ncbi:hypothetical protein N836_15680 [Leptolyngbya sp. Heron Island J]|uniref:hypothetical protein n=1 Tax=Leptolyngbya sp. Heron Island J TaxID=1385935 RepID=UPI0003B9C1DF|nr:hypothetical protein [Leptolyngbya sp. Heron Island J]ESA34857.1 hypothetical protein N836_15680 [Leptolyngbya sp. Heron Island J]
MDDFCEWLNDLLNGANELSFWVTRNRPVKIEPILVGGFCVSLISRILIPGPLGWVPLILFTVMILRMPTTDDD